MYNLYRPIREMLLPTLSFRRLKVRLNLWEYFVSDCSPQIREPILTDEIFTRVHTSCSLVCLICGTTHD